MGIEEKYRRTNCIAMEMRSKSKRERKKENEKELRVLFASFELEQEKYIQCTGRYSETELI